MIIIAIDAERQDWYRERERHIHKLLMFPVMLKFVGQKQA